MLTVPRARSRLTASIAGPRELSSGTIPFRHLGIDVRASAHDDSDLMTLIAHDMGMGGHRHFDAADPGRSGVMRDRDSQWQRLIRSELTRIARSI